MDVNQLYLIDEYDFIEYSLDQTIEVLEAIESINWMGIGNDDLKENESFFSRLLGIAEKKIIENNFDELKDDETKKNHLLLWILRIRIGISQYRLTVLRDNATLRVLVAKNDVEKIASEATRVAKSAKDTAQEVATAAQEARTAAQEAKAGAQQVIDSAQDIAKTFASDINTKAKDAIDKIEPQIMATILTVMGVFSAIITIIMSVVITSSSWLNNANGASAVIAFIVPNLVAIIAVIVLLGIVLVRKGEPIILVPERSWDDSHIAEKTLKKVKRISIAVVIFILFFITAIAVFAGIEIINLDKPHVRHILTEDMYEIVTYEFEADETEEPKEPEVKIEFNFDGKRHSILYDKKYFHDGSLYYCAEHERLE